MTGAVTSALTARPARRAVRRAVVAATAVVMLCLVCVGGATVALLGGLVGENTPAYPLGCGNGQQIDPNGTLARVGGLVEGQVRNAAIIIQVGQGMKIPPRGWVIAIATALQESRLNNLPDLGPRNDHDSIGLFQQRPSQGWGTLEQLADPAYQTRKFFEKLQRVTNWQLLPLTVVAQRIQISAFPNAYAKHEPLASQTVDAITCPSVDR